MGTQGLTLWFCTPVAGLALLPLCSSSHPSASASGTAMKAPLPKATDISARRPASPVPSSSSTRALEGPQQDQRDRTSGCSCLNPAPVLPTFAFLMVSL